MTDPATYVVTDIECDGPWPGQNSMLSFASVAVRVDGTRLGEFEAVLAGLPGASPEPKTHAWFLTVPEAWEAATTDPFPPEQVMADFAGWVRSLPRPRVFAAHPVAFDGMWIDYYLRQITASRLPPEWLGDVPHTHRAIDDARGYAHLLTVLLAQRR